MMLLIMSKNLKVARSNMTVDNKSACSRYECWRIALINRRRKHSIVFSSFVTYHRVCNWSNPMGAASGAGTDYPSGAPEVTPSCKCGSGSSILFFFVQRFADRCLSFFSFGYCVVCPSICIFWLLIWSFQTLLKQQSIKRIIMPYNIILHSKVVWCTFTLIVVLSLHCICV